MLISCRKIWYNRTISQWGAQEIFCLPVTCSILSLHCIQHRENPWDHAIRLPNGSTGHRSGWFFAGAPRLLSASESLKRQKWIKKIPRRNIWVEKIWHGCKNISVTKRKLLMPKFVHVDWLFFVFSIFPPMVVFCREAGQRLQSWTTQQRSIMGYIQNIKISIYILFIKIDIYIYMNFHTSVNNNCIRLIVDMHRDSLKVPLLKSTTAPQLTAQPNGLMVRPSITA